MAGNASHHRAGLPDRGPDVGAVNGSSDRFSSHDAQEESSPSDTNGDRALTIGEVAQEYGITLRTLRFYEAKRLLNPYRHGATRLYRSSDRKRLSVILTGRRLGFTLAEIKHLSEPAPGRRLAPHTRAVRETDQNARAAKTQYRNSDHRAAANSHLILPKTSRRLERALALNDLRCGGCESARSAQTRCDASPLEHDPEKWNPVFRKDHAQTKS